MTTQTATRNLTNLLLDLTMLCRSEIPRGVKLSDVQGTAAANAQAVALAAKDGEYPNVAQALADFEAQR